MPNAKVVGYCALAILIALSVVGAVSETPGSLRHQVQTLPLWFPIVAGLQNQPLAKWAALPCLIFWLGIMTFIWLFLLGLRSPVSGTFNPTEIGMTASRDWPPEGRRRGRAGARRPASRIHEFPPG